MQIEISLFLAESSSIYTTYLRYKKKHPKMKKNQLSIVNLNYIITSCSVFLKPIFLNILDPFYRQSFKSFMCLYISAFYVFCTIYTYISYDRVTGLKSISVIGIAMQVKI